MLTADELAEVVRPQVGPRGRVTVLKDKPGRRRTSRVVGASGTVVCKQYTTGRSSSVADRLGVLAAGPATPRLPRVLARHPEHDLVVIGHLQGDSLGPAIDATRTEPVARAGRALGGWHAAWRGRPVNLRRHLLERELAILEDWAGRSRPALARAVARQMAEIDPSWPIETVVHRDLYEEQILVGNDVGLVDLDDVARGPAALDLGNLVAHLLLRTGVGTEFDRLVGALLRGYRNAGGQVDHERLDACLRLSLLRLACIHDQDWLVEVAAGPTEVRLALGRRAA